MQISQCGNNSQKLEEICDIILEHERKTTGKKATIYRINQVDDELFKAYQSILYEVSECSPETRGEIIASSLNNLKTTIQSGTSDLSNLKALAVETVHKTLEEKGQLSVTPNISEKVQVFVNGAIVLTASEEKIKNAICTPEMEKGYKEVYEKAIAGDENALATADVMRKAVNYMAIKEKLNPKGKEKGAMALVAQLLSTGDKSAGTLANQMVKEFNLEDKFKGKAVNDENAQEVFNKMVPTASISGIKERHRKNVHIYAPLMKKELSESFNQMYLDIVKNKRVVDFSRTFNAAVSRGDKATAKKLVSENPELVDEMDKMQTDIIERMKERQKFTREYIDSLRDER